MRNFSKDAISFNKAKRLGIYLGYYLTRKYGFGPEFWKIEVYDINGKLYGGDRLEGKLEPMIEEMREEILKVLKK